MDFYCTRKCTVIILTVIIIIKLTLCTKFYDDISVEKYCPSDKICEGSEHKGPHIVCEYYGVIGEQCVDFIDYPLTEKLVTNILNQFNQARAKVARGVARGWDDQYLPRGYGVMRMFWDSELAAFAKFMLPMCFHVHQYMCAATERFRNPVMAYMHGNFTESVTTPKDMIEEIFNCWNAAAKSVDIEMIKSSPPLIKGPQRRYIKMLMGNATHIGCALATYYNTQVGRRTIDSHFLCYISYWTPVGSPVYTTTPPVPGDGYTERCGCPPYHKETEDCLCEAIPRTPVSTSKPLPQSEPVWRQQSSIEQQTNKPEPITNEAPVCRTEKKCEPKIMMLPIFTIQNAPSPQSNKDNRRQKLHNRRNWNSKEEVSHRFSKQAPHRSYHSSFEPIKTIDDVSSSEEKYYDSEEKHEEYEAPPRNVSIRSQLLRNARNTRLEEPPFLSEEIMESDHHPHILDPNDAFSKQKYDQSYKYKKNIMSLLDRLEQKGKDTQLTSHEFLVFDAKMRQIYKTVLGQNQKKRTVNVDDE